MTRTPITLDDMKWGDRIERQVGSDYTFIGRHPTDNLGFLAVTKVGAVVSCRDIGGWHKLEDTPLERHVSWRCTNMGPHGLPDNVPLPCPDCYSIESYWRRIPYEPDSRTQVDGYPDEDSR